MCFTTNQKGHIMTNTKTGLSKTEASALVAQNLFNAQGAWNRATFHILIDAGYNRDAVNKALQEINDNITRTINSFSKIVRKVEE